jgi:peptidoglycan hydrolase CwlO-like protein
MNGMDRFCLSLQEQNEFLRNKLRTEQRERADEVLSLKLRLIDKKHQIKNIEYERDGFKRKAEVLQECIDADKRRRLELIDTPL